MGFDRDEPSSFDKFQGFYIFFGLLVVCLGAAKVSESYLVSVVLKEELSSYAAIRGVMADYYLVASFFVILITIGIGRQVQRTHTSPIRLIIVYIGSVLTVALVATWTDVFYAFLALAIVRRVTENSLLNPAVQMVITSFAGKLRTKLRSAHSIFYYSAVGVPLALLYSYTSSALESERVLLGSIIITLLAIALVLLMGFEKRLVEALYQFVYQGNKTSAVGAVQALSFLKPPKYSEHMGELLSGEPKQILRKTIIMGLGHVRHDDSTTETILNQFKSDKEEIQIAVLDALKLSNRYEAIQFLAKIMMAKEMSHSLKVRMNAAQMIASLYGRKAIPFLLNGLEDEDERVVANTLEVLSVFKDKNLARYFREFVESPVPRVRANALMGLAHYRQERELYEGITREILDGYDTQMLVSVLYVVGSLRDKTFMKHLDNLMKSPLVQDPMVRRGLAWVFTRLEDERGFELFAQLFGAPWDGKEEPFMHFVSQLSSHLRFDLIKYIAVRYYDDTDIIVAVNEKLEVSHFDFNEEIQYLEILLDTIGESRRASKKGLRERFS
jgi:HEAT repeat protein